MTTHERNLQLFIRIIGTSALLALPCVALPYALMDAVHQWLGMGRLPAEPVVGYLARSTSAFYAMLGGLLWLVSFDLRRNHLVLCYLGGVFISFGMILFVVDLVEGLPLFWRLGEGPLDAGFGIVILWLSYRIGQDSQSASAK